MGFWSDFAETFNTVAYASFDTIAFEATEQSNKVAAKYQQRLADPNYRSARENHRIMMSMNADAARKAFHINAETKPAEASKPEAKKPRTRKTRNTQAPKSEASSN